MFVRDLLETKEPVYNWSKYAAQGLANRLAVLRLIAVVITKQSSQYISQLEYVGIGQYENYRPGT